MTVTNRAFEINKYYLTNMISISAPKNNELSINTGESFKVRALYVIWICSSLKIENILPKSDMRLTQ